MDPNKNINWRNVLIVFIGLIIVWFLFNALTISNGYMPNYGSHMNGSLNTGINFGGFVFGLLLIAVKLLWILLLVALALGLYHEGKKYFANNTQNGLNISPFLEKLTNSQNDYLCPSCNEKLSQEFKFCPICKVNLQSKCGSCGKELLASWKCCPCCGTETKKEEPGNE